MEIHPAGSKFWRLRYKQSDGKTKELTFGKYPEVSLVAARGKRSEALGLLSAGIDPARHKERKREEALAIEKNTFEKLSREWHEVKAKSWSENYAKNVLYRLELDILPEVGRIPINEITHRQMIDTLRKIEQRGAHEIAKRQRAVCSQISSYAIQAGVGTRNPIVDMRDILQRVTPTSFPAISPDELPEFLDIHSVLDLLTTNVEHAGRKLQMFAVPEAARNDTGTEDTG